MYNRKAYNFHVILLFTLVAGAFVLGKAHAGDCVVAQAEYRQALAQRSLARAQFNSLEIELIAVKRQLVLGDNSAELYARYVELCAREQVLAGQFMAAEKRLQEARDELETCGLQG